MATDDQLVVEVNPDDIELGFDNDGLPKTVAKNGGAQKPEGDAEPQWSEADRKQIDDLKRERDEAARIATEARAREAEARSQVTTEREARTAAEKTAEQNRLAKMRSDWDLLQADAEQIKSALNANKVELTAAESDYQTALTNADYETAAKIQSKIAKLASFETRLEEAKNTSERRIADARRVIEQELAAPKKEEPKPEVKKEQPKQITPDEWIDNVRKEVGSTVADWLKEHREFVTDSKLHAKLLKFADAYATVDEKPLNDPEFIKALESKFLPKKAQAEPEEIDDNEAIVVDTEPKRAAPSAKTVAAPVSRATTPAKSSTTNNDYKVKLSPDQAEMAVKLYEGKPHPDTGQPMTPQQARQHYGANLLRAHSDGKFASR